jgi:RNA-binding protein YlmH
LIEVFCAEFKAFKAAYYDEAIANGKITVNFSKVDKMYKIKEGD